MEEPAYVKISCVFYVNKSEFMARLRILYLNISNKINKLSSQISTMVKMFRVILLEKSQFGNRIKIAILT